MDNDIECENDNATDPANGSGVSRRNLLTGLGAMAAGAGALAIPGNAAAGAPPLTAVNLQPEVLSAATPGLQYLPIDGFDFHVDTNYTIPSIPIRYSTDADGLLLSSAGEVAASIPLSVGSVIRQINIGYRGSPILNFFQRQLDVPLGGTRATTVQTNSQTLVAAGGYGTQTINLAPVAVVANSTYSIRFYLEPGSSIFGVTIGYTSATQSFVPFSGANPRLYDSRPPSVDGKLKAGEDRVISLGSVGARSALFNLTVTGTEGAGGYVGAYSAAVPTWPGNSSVNWFGAGQNLANGVTCAVDGTGKIKLHGGDNNTHVIVDIIGYFL